VTQNAGMRGSVSNDVLQCLRIATLYNVITRINSVETVCTTLLCIYEEVTNT